MRVVIDARALATYLRNQYDHYGRVVRDTNVKAE